MSAPAIVRLSPENRLERDWAAIEAVAHQGGMPEHDEGEVISLEGEDIVIAIMRARGTNRRTLIVEQGGQHEVYQEADDPREAWFFPSDPHQERTPLGPDNLYLMVRSVAAMREAAERRPDLVTVGPALDAAVLQRLERQMLGRLFMEGWSQAAA